MTLQRIEWHTQHAALVSKSFLDRCKAVLVCGKTAISAKRLGKNKVVSDYYPQMIAAMQAHDWPQAAD